jgi:hypothetical protein
MRTRSLFVSGLFDVEHRTDGWYFRQLHCDEPWNGPHLDCGAVAQALTDELVGQIRNFYQLRYREAPP